MATSKHIKIKLREVNRHLVCRLCRGYYVDATTIAECLHSFCRSCIIKYLEKNSFCPICEVQIHKTKPYLNLRLDKALQDVVYKVVPGLYHDEMKRRREFYSNRQEQIPFATPEQCGLEERIIFSPEDSISLSLEYLESDDCESETVSSQSSESGDNPDLLSFPQQLGLIKLKNTDGKTSRRESQDLQETPTFPKRYLQCPAVVNVGHLKKFIRMKHDLTDKMQVSVMHKKVPLPDHYTLMDVAYIYTWKRNSPLRFFYQIYQTKKHKLKVDSTINETEDLKHQLVPEQSKLSKTVDNEIVNKLPPEVKTQDSSNNKSEILRSDVKQTVKSHESKNVSNGRMLKETKPEKSANSLLSDSAKNEAKEEFEVGSDLNVSSQNNKNEKLKLNSDNTLESKNKVGFQNRKSSKVENSATSVQEAKENKVEDKERLLLNPISGKLESVPSADHCKSINHANGANEKKENKDCAKKDVPVKGQKKTESQNSKDFKKSNVNLLKSFRKEKLSVRKDSKVEIRNNSLTITPISKNEKSPEKETGNFSVEIKADSKESEYDFDGSSPPSKIIPLQKFSKYSNFSKYMAEHRDKWLSKESKNSWMSLKDFREKMMKENDLNEQDAFIKSKKKGVPSLYKLNSEGNKKTPNGKLLNETPKESKTSTIINIKTENDVPKPESEAEVTPVKTNSPLQVTKVDNKDGECSAKALNEKEPSAVDVGDSKSNIEFQKQIEIKAESETQSNSLGKEPSAFPSDQGNTESKSPKSSAKNSHELIKSEVLEVMDLSKVETSPNSEKNPLENLMDMANKTGAPKTDEKMVDALLSAAQKQSIEPLLKIPQYSQMLKNSSLSPGKNNLGEISQVFKILEDLRYDFKILEEAKNKLNPNSVLEHFAQKSGNLEPYQQLYQQKIDLIRRLKRQQQIMPNDLDVSPKKQLKLSPTSESKKKLSSSPEQNAKTSPTSEEIAQYKSSMERTLSQIQLMELQSRMIAAHNYKNLPALLQYYTRPPNFSSGSTSPSKSNQQKTKPSSHSPNKSTQSLGSSSGNSQLSASGSDSPFFNHQSYSPLINAGLNSEMTYHQMFQSYLNQQEQMNQVKLSQASKKPVKFSEVSPKSSSDKYCAPQTSVKMQELNNSVSPVQKS